MGGYPGGGMGGYPGGGVYGPGMINGGAGIAVGPGYPNNGGYFGSTGGFSGGSGYGVPGMSGDYYNQQNQQMQMQMAMQGQAMAGDMRMQGNQSVNQMGGYALNQNYSNARNDLYGMNGAGYYGGSPYAAGNLGGQFSVNAGIGLNYGGGAGFNLYH